MPNQKSSLPTKEIINKRPSIYSDLQLSPYPKHTLIDTYVWLRPIFPSDYKPLLKILCNPEKMKYLRGSKGLSEEQVKNEISRQARKNFEDSSQQIFIKGNQATLGCKDRSVSFTWAFFTAKGLSGRITLYILREGEGIEIGGCSSGGTAKAAEAILKYISDKDFLAVVHPENSASQKILAELGFIKDLKKLSEIGYATYQETVRCYSF